MLSGVSLPIFTFLHVIVSLFAMISGAAVLSAMFRSRAGGTMFALFLWSEVIACISGFAFMIPFPRFALGHKIGLISLLVLIPTVAALYRYRLAGLWRHVHVIGTAALIYLNVFIGVRQAFAKQPALRGEAELIQYVHVFMFVVFALVCWRALRRFRPATDQAAPVPPAISRRGGLLLN